MLNSISIKNKLFLLVGITLVLMALLGLQGMYTQNARLEHSLAEASLAASPIQASDAAAIHFKTQVQEWKNLHLRGQEQTDYDRHLETLLSKRPWKSPGPSSKTRS